MNIGFNHQSNGCRSEAACLAAGTAFVANVGLGRKRNFGLLQLKTWYRIPAG
ncbi:MAG: phospholipase A [Desulfobacterales bacterium]|nr:phospholipase A [Desulfobacterales bacterium]